MNTTGGKDMNVIKYYGSLMEGPRVWIIMELAEGGSIRTLVSSHQSDPGYEVLGLICSRELNL
jgi:serine/threonine protein kinase